MSDDRSNPFNRLLVWGADRIAGALEREHTGHQPDRKKPDKGYSSGGGLPPAGPPPKEGGELPKVATTVQPSNDSRDEAPPALSIRRQLGRGDWAPTVERFARQIDESDCDVGEGLFIVRLILASHAVPDDQIDEIVRAVAGEIS